MAKGYWVSAYRKVLKPEQLAEYSKLATSAIRAGGGRVLARGVAAFAHGAGIAERTVLVEFDSLEQAKAAFERINNFFAPVISANTFVKLLSQNA